MTRMRVWILLTVLLFVAASAFAAEPFMPRYPAISPDGSTVVFSFQGDLWSVASNGGMATRLTVHPAYDSAPIFSPDGSIIAFASDRHGDVDIYTMPAIGGAPTRVTHASTTDAPYAFSKDGKTIYFASSRMFDYPMGRQIQSIPTSGGTPFRLADMYGNQIAVGPDGSFVIAEGREKFGRLRYRGTYQRQLYSYSPGNDPVQLTTHDGVDTKPMIAPDGTIYWVNDSDRNQVRNIWRMNADGSDKQQVTKFKEDGVRWANISENGSRMVIERGTKLYSLDLAGGNPFELEIHVANDQMENLVTVETFRGDADEVSISGDGEDFAMLIHGDIVITSKELGGRSVVPIPGPSREENIEFRPTDNADTLAFVTDRFGEKTLCLLLSDDPDESNLRLAKKHKIVKLTNTKTPAVDPVWSPDGSKIAYTYGNGDIHIMDHDGGNDYALDESWSEPHYSWAPDGNWIAFAREDRNFNSDIWIIPAEGGDKVNISTHPDEDFGPEWSEDGSLIAWTTRRHDNQYDVYYTYLTKELDERTREEWEIWEKTRDNPPKEDPAEEEEEGEDGEDGEDAEDEEEAEEEEFVITIDFDEIYLRGRRATRSPNSEFAAGLHPKGDKIFFMRTVSGDRSLNSVTRFADDEEEVASGRFSDIEFTDETFYLLSGGKPGYVGMGGGSVETTDFNARLTLDKPATRLQVIDEGYRVLKHWFYDPDMHGLDWDKLGKKYGEWAGQVQHDRDFADIVNIMLGELNASHMGYYPDTESDGEGPNDGYIGVEFDPTYQGNGLRVKWVLPNSPADETDMRLVPGDIVTMVNDTEVGRTSNIYTALEDQQGVPITISWTHDGEDMDGEIVPFGWRAMYGLVYQNFERSNRAHVEEISDDRVGYVHIQGMGWNEVELFERDLYAVADDKDALIIDVRNNGGGWTTDMFLTILTQPVHGYTIGRNGEVGYPQPRYPMYRWEKPIAVICNAGSYSNAEIFSHAVKTIDRGPVIGEETGGNVISTGGWSTMDGGWIRMPFRGWYVWGDKTDPSRNNKNQEAPGAGWGGAVPDYPVPFTHADRIADRDPQLDKAIELMIEAANAEARLPKPGDVRGKVNYETP
jgi:tricorn protease